MRKSIKSIFTLSVALIVFVTAFNAGKIEASAAVMTSIKSGGIYYIRNVNSGMYMEANGTTSGSNVRQAAFSGATKQQFKLTLVEGSGASAYYTMTPMNATTLRVDVYNMWTGNATPIKIGTANTTAYLEAQRFKFTDCGNNSYRIVPKCCANVPNQVFEVPGASMSAANIQLWDYNYVGTKANKQWELEEVTPYTDGDVYFLRSKQTGKYMEVPNANSGSRLQQGAYTGNTNQQFKLKLMSGSLTTAYFQMIPMNNTNLRVDVVNMNTQPNAELALFTDNSASYPGAQYFRFIKNSNETISIKPKCSIDAGVNTIFTLNTTDSKIRLGTANNSPTQQWLLEKVKYKAAVYNYFDTGYEKFYYGNNNPTATKDIKGYQDAVSQALMQQLRLKVSTQTPAYCINNKSSGDNCKGTVTTTNLNTLSPHTPACTELNTLFGYFNKTGSGETTNVIWSGHRYTKNGTIYEGGGSSGYKVAMLERSIANRARDSKGVLLHELCHQYSEGLTSLDHYCQLDNAGKCIIALCSKHNKSTRPESCIMYNAQQNITSVIICAECKRDIYSHLNSKSAHWY